MQVSTALVLVSLTALLLAGCGSPQGPSVEEPPPTDVMVVAPVEPAPPPDDPVVAPVEPPAVEPTAPPTPAGSFTEAANAFAMDLWAKLRGTSGNLTISPASIWVALAMTQEGARGETATEMARVMRMPTDADAARADAGRRLAAWNAAGRGDLTLRVVNRLFGEKSYRFEPPFVRTTRARWHAPLEPTDFRQAPEPARARINAWVASATQDRIRDLLPAGSIVADTRLVLTNAVYFLGKWVQPFEVRGTHDAPFFTAPGQSAPVPTMHQTATFSYAETDGVQLLQLPYRGGSFAMTLVLPRAIDGLPAVEARLHAATLAGWVAALGEDRVRVSLPKFTIDPPSSLPLSRVLRDMGMRLAFDRAAADFTGIANPPSPDDRLSISEVFHKAFVKVDEEGTEAAAATAVVMVRAGAAAPRPTPEFRADHPFLFFLRDTATGEILFSGRVATPR